MKEAKIRPSIAEDTGTDVRLTQHVLTEILNKLGTLHEVFDTQAHYLVFQCRYLLSPSV